jgi:hypothetical protein
MSKHICFKVDEEVYERFLLLDDETKTRVRELIEAILRLVSR